MPITTFRRLRRLAVALLAAGATASAVPAAAMAASPCNGSKQSLSEGTTQQLSATTLCLINRQRARHGLRALRADARLARAADRHSRDMVAHRYFAHDSRTGARFSARIARTGWMAGRDRWTVGENLAWGSGDLGSPRAIVSAWMSSAPHRANILKPAFRVIGIGIRAGVPVERGGDGATYTTDFGS